MFKKTIQRVELGDLVRCKITGFDGITTQKVYYLQGCVRFCVTPQGLTSDGKMKESHYIDEPQLEIVTKGFYKVEEGIIQETRTGGFCDQRPTK
jgi:hypothetical protein